MEKIAEKNEIICFLQKKKQREKFLAFDLYKKRQCRCVIEDESHVFVFSYKSKKYGLRMTFNVFADNYHVFVNDENAQWIRRMKRVVKLLEESGLWSNIKEQYQNVLNSGMTLQDKKRIEEIYWSLCPSTHIPKEEIDKAFGDFPKKFPFVFRRDKDGKLDVDTKYIWELSRCELKSMYFGKYDNTQYKDNIKKAISEKRDYRIYRLPLNYDVTFEYSASKNMAWYSEEYRNCGNGHYYIALNHSTALFCEND